ncbi:MAG: M48 family metalloprotease [Geminicoccaceae bacterium]|nr:M48 family metalloprotease [Geminicoccaceae bacterium]
MTVGVCRIGRSLRRIGLALLAALLLLPGVAGAVSLIRDEEIERTLRDVAQPLFEAAGLDPQSVSIYLVNDPQINAFVAGGQNLFIHTGLLVRSRSLDQVAGVIAHETGHIAAGHLSRLGDASRRASAEALIGAVLGAAAAVAGAPQVGTAIIAGGATMAERGLLKFSRGQEQAADQAGVSFLERAGRSPEGMLEFFRILETQNLRIDVDGSVFLRTHPLTRSRIQFLEAQVARAPAVIRPAALEAEEAVRHARMVAKLEGFLAPEAQVLQRYAGDGFADRYARAIARYRVGQIDQALDLLRDLRASAPDDPWLLELEGQILFESGRIEAAVEPYRRALTGAPRSALLRLGLARALMEGGGAGLPEAIGLLDEAVTIEPTSPAMWRFLGLALGRDGREVAASLALAEHAVLTRNREDAALFLAKARRRIEPGDPEWLHLQDLQRAADELETG